MITINAPRDTVWPWIVQMGIERASFYTHDWVERSLFGARYVEGRHSATRIHPELQDSGMLKGIKARAEGMEQR